MLGLLLLCFILQDIGKVKGQVIKLIHVPRCPGFFDPCPGFFLVHYELQIMSRSDRIACHSLEPNQDSFLAKFDLFFWRKFKDFKVYIIFGKRKSSKKITNMNFFKERRSSAWSPIRFLMHPRSCCRRNSVVFPPEKIENKPGQLSRFHRSSSQHLQSFQDQKV